jgi:DNA repair protein RadC
MTKLSADVEGWPGEALVAAVLATGPFEGARAERASVLAAALLCDHGGFGGLARTTVEELETYLATAPHLGRPPRACARRIAAAFELGRRVAHDSVAPRSIASSADVAAWAAARLSNLDHEELWLLALDGRSRLRAVRCVAKGGLHGMGVRPADPLRLALRAAASGFVLVHNHPSGDPTPSAEDIAFTRRLASAAVIVGTPLLDHVVVARDGFSSVPFATESASLAAGAVDA